MDGAAFCKTWSVCLFCLQVYDFEGDELLLSMDCAAFQCLQDLALLDHAEQGKLNQQAEQQNEQQETSSEQKGRRRETDRRRTVLLQMAKSTFNSSHYEELFKYNVDLVLRSGPRAQEMLK
jgi:hypothetical protein